MLKKREIVVVKHSLFNEVTRVPRDYLKTWETAGWKLLKGGFNSFLEAIHFIDAYRLMVSSNED